MGGRIASMLTSEKAHPAISGCICLGYPFHPPGKTRKLRTSHLQSIDTPCLIIQGTKRPSWQKRTKWKPILSIQKSKSNGSKMVSTV